MPLLRSARLADGRLVDVTVADGRIAAIVDRADRGEPPEAAAAATTGQRAPEASGSSVGHRGHATHTGPASKPVSDATRPGATGNDDTIELDGYLLLPAPAEPHAHLDKALTADLVPNPAGDLLGAIDAWMAAYPDRTVDEIAERARRAVLRNLTYGVTAVRTHVDVNAWIGMRGVEALLRVKADLAPAVELQLVALVARPLPGQPPDANWRALDAALAAGVDVVGGAPHVDPDPTGHLERALAAASAAGRPLDLHMDEHLDRRLDLPLLVRRVTETGFAHGVVASHCVSLGMQPPEVQDRVGGDLARAGISVVTLPHTNLYLQARGCRVAPPRGLTAVSALLAAGVNLAAGADNQQDPFNPMGRGDPLETAALLVMAGHLTPEQAYAAVSTGARRAMGLPAVHIAVGAPAELLAVRATSLRDAIATAPADRLVFRAGRLVARTSTETELFGT